MENSQQIAQPTLVDPTSIKQLDPHYDSTKLIEQIQKTNYRENFVKDLKRSTFFSEEKVKFKKEDVPIEPASNNGGIQKKTVIAIIVIVIMIIITIFVTKKHNRFKREDEELLSSDPNPEYSLFRDIRKTNLGLNILITTETLFYFCILLGAAYLLNKITDQTNDTFSQK